MQALKIARWLEQMSDVCLMHHFPLGGVPTVSGIDTRDGAGADGPMPPIPE